MDDPEDGLSFRLKRLQFNNRIPEVIFDLMKKFGDDKKYVNEYLLWLFCKYYGDTSSIDPLYINLLEKYFENVRAYLEKKQVLRDDADIFFGIDEHLKKRLGEKTRSRAKLATE